jgi:uncharacterized membrane protein YdjX (TVP38/TMEM64 family)
MFEELLNTAISLYGPWGLFVVMVIQTIIAPIPSEALLAFAGVIGISLLNVTVFGGLGLIVGAVIAFLIGRWGGKPIVEKILGAKWVGVLDEWVKKHGTLTIFVTRLVPFIPFDLVSYCCGITDLPFSNYLAATLLGAFPRCLLLAALGTTFGAVFSMIGLGLDVILVLGFGGLILLIWMDRKGYIDLLGNRIIRRIINS